ncbi:MAG: ABC-type Mn/Zn transport system, ATPase component [Herbinix sp.]|jgi:zinc transport system ATP-binding protein|nr:ABC-type Mn/Zn transport system, ATPase component [Herbinix sp.]
MSQILCKEITLAYENHYVIEDLSFNVLYGDYICIVGENGTGKSTLIKTLLGLKQPVRGGITLGDGLKRSMIGYLPQQSNIQKDFPASVYEVVLSGCLNTMGMRPFYTKKNKKSANENIRKLGLEYLIDKCYRELSGGQQQRVLLARALCAAHKIIVLDEPVNGLDPFAATEFYEMLHQLNRDENITIIMVSHDIKSAIQHADHIMHLKSDSFFYGKTTDYIKSDIGKTFFGGDLDV